MPGIAFSPSRVAPTISGSAISDIIDPAIRNERPNAVSAPSGLNESAERNASEKMMRPKIASTIDGVPAMTSTPDSTARARPRGRPYSVSHSAIADAERQRDQRSRSS